MKRTEQEITNLIYEELNSEKPDKSVLNAAENLMLQKKKTSIKKRFSFFKSADHAVSDKTVISTKNIRKRKICAAICTSIVAIAIICCIPFIVNDNEYIPDTELTAKNISSIQYYNDEMLSFPYNIENSTLYIDINNNDVYIKETYTVDTTIIELYILLNKDYLGLPAFDIFINLSEAYSYNEIAISYGIAQNKYCAKFYFSNYYYFISANAKSQEEILFYVNELIDQID